METRPDSRKSNYFNLAILALIVVTLGISFYHYFIKLNYDLYLQTECDPSTEVCTTDEESYYHKFIAPAYLIENRCVGDQDESCILSLHKEGLVEKLSCEDNLEEWEYCTDPAEYEEEIEIEEEIAAEEAIAEEEPITESNEE